MTQKVDPQDRTKFMGMDSERSSCKKKKKILRWSKRLGFVFFFLLVGSGIGTIIGGYLVRKELIPIVDVELEKYLHRRVEIGELKKISLTSASFGKSEIPETEDNPDTVSLESVEVRFNPLPFILSRRLPLRIILIRPDIYIEQDSKGLWTPTKFGTGEKQEGGIKVDVKSIKLKQANLTLVGYNQEKKKNNPPVVTRLNRGVANFLDDGELIKFNLNGGLKKGGKLNVKGKAINETGEINLHLLGENLVAKEIENLLSLPIELNEGNVDTNLNVILKDKPIPELYGKAKLKNVTMQVPGLANPFSKSNGNLGFKDSSIELKGVNTFFDRVTGVIKGSLDIEGQGSYDINAEIDPVEIDRVIEALDMETPPVVIEGKIKGDVSLSGDFLNPITEFDVITTSSSVIDRLNFKEIQSNLNLVGNTLYVKRLFLNPVLGGTIKGGGTIELEDEQNIFLNLRGDNLPGNNIAKVYDLDIPIDVGLVDGDAKVRVKANDINTFEIITADLDLSTGEGIINLNNLRGKSGKWNCDVIVSDVKFNSLPFGKDSTPTIGNGLVNGNFIAEGIVNDPQLKSVVAKGQATVDTVGGKVVSPEINISDGNWEGKFNTSNLKLRTLFPEVPSEFKDNLDGNFYLTGKLVGGTEDSITGKGRLEVVGGSVDIPELEIMGNDWELLAITNNLKLKEINSETPEQFAGLVNGKFNVSGTMDNITPERIISNGNGSLTLREGIFSINNLAVSEGKFKTTVIPQSVDLDLFADPNSDDFILEGLLGGSLEVTGTVDKITPTAVSAKGNATFSKGIDFLDSPFTANILWNGKRLKVLSTTGNKLNAKGYIDLSPRFFEDIPDKLTAVDYFNFNVPSAKDIDINKLKLTLPTWAINLDRSGKVDFSGTVKGIPTTMDIDGKLTLNKFIVENLNFDRPLIGKIKTDPKTGMNFDIKDNKNSRIQFDLDKDFLPLSFIFNHQDIKVRGTGKREIIQFTVADFPVQLLKTIAIKSPDLDVPKNIERTPLSGNLSGQFYSNLNTLATAGENVIIERPLLGKIKGKKITSNFQYAEDYFSLENTEFQQGKTKYKLQGKLITENNDTQVEGKISVKEGQIQDILIALEIFEIEDFKSFFKDRQYGNSKNLELEKNPIQINQKNIPISSLNPLGRIEYFAQLNALLEIIRQRRRAGKLFPELNALQGTFDGQVNINGSLSQGINSDFNFKGKKWQWGNLIAEKIIFNGNLQDRILTILPAIIELENIDTQPNNNPPQIIFAGTLSEQGQFGQFRLSYIPIKSIEKLVKFPPEIAFGGIISGSATLAGTAEKPQAKGEINIDNATINQTSIQSTQGSFDFNNSRLKFSASSIVAKDADPLTITGSLPLQLPFNNIPPKSDRLEINLNLKDKGFTLLNILSRGELNWLEGQGEVNLKLDGRLDLTNNQPSKITAKGTTIIKNGTIAARNLPEELLTNLNGNISFNLDRISVKEFEGDFGGGKIFAKGTIPLTKETKQENPLNIDFNKLGIDLKGLYKGGLEGNIKILGTVIEPDITGEITLSEGTILLSETTPTDVTTIPEEEGIAALTEYKNLKLKLGKNIRISQPPIFTFIADGTLTVNGTYLQPLPQGTITLKRGQVNLFTTQLSLARGEKNTARFSPNNQLDPDLDILLVGSALESTQNLITEDPLSTEIEDIPASRLGTIETIRISARVNGLASQITNKLELTSSPPRSRTEILALLGGSFVNTLGKGDSTLGLANFVGSALFGSLNAEFNNAFPIGELRLFPTQIIGEGSERKRIDALAGEVAINITDRVSFSVLKILTEDELAQFGIRFRLNENFVLRGSSNFDDDSRTILEYELRF